MGLGWFDDLGAEAVDKFITGLGHQLSIILLLGYVLLYVTTDSAEFFVGCLNVLSFALLLHIINMSKLSESVLVTPKIQLRKTNLHQSQDNAKRTINPSRPDFS